MAFSVPLSFFYGVGVPVQPACPPGQGVGIVASPLVLTAARSVLIVVLVVWLGFQDGAPGNSVLFAALRAAMSFSSVVSGPFGDVFSDTNQA